MKKLLIATATAATLLAGVGAASAQTWQNDGYYGRGPMIERGVGLRAGPVGVGVYGESRAYDDDNYAAPRTRSNSQDESVNYRAQPVWPQSPPSGGY